MKNIVLLLALVSLFLTGCARHYVMTLNNGSRITTKGKPKLQGNDYVYKDVMGQPGAVSSGRVREISPASMSESSSASGFKAGPSK
jgi:hypothetical protein